MYLQNRYKEQLAALKKKLQDSSRQSEHARKQELAREADKKKDMLARRLEQRKLQVQRAKEKEAAAKVRLLVMSLVDFSFVSLLGDGSTLKFCWCGTAISDDIQTLVLSVW